MCIRDRLPSSKEGVATRVNIISHSAMTLILSVVNSILLNEKSLIVGCTTNPGDCNDFQNALKDTGIDVFYNPEFIAQGSIITDLQNSDMVIIGGDGNHKSELEQIYEKIQMGFISPSIYFMSTKAAEVTKIAVNCFLTTKISYANMLGQVLTTVSYTHLTLPTTPYV